MCTSLADFIVIDFLESHSLAEPAATLSASLAEAAKQSTEFERQENEEPPESDNNATRIQFRFPGSFAILIVS